MFLRLEQYLGVDFLTFHFIGSFSFHSQLRLRLNVLFLCKEVKIGTYEIVWYTIYSIDSYMITNCRPKMKTVFCHFNGLT